MRSIVHLDLDTFFVSVARLDHPELRGKPVLIGGSSGRGVVASCSYEARHFGIHSAMPMKFARQLCPEAIVLHGDFERYTHYSRMVTEIIQESVPLYEKASIDEFYMDLSGMDRFFGCYKFAGELATRIRNETGLPLSFGLSSNKTVSKVATGEAKPAGKLQVATGAEQPFLAPLPVRKIPMIGPQTGRQLAEMGIMRIKTLQEMPPELLERVFGKPGYEMWKRARGIDNAPVRRYDEQKSLSAEQTFEVDTIDVAMLLRRMATMTEQLAGELRKQQKLVSIVTVKLRYSNFQTFTRQQQVPYTATDYQLIPVVKHLFDKLYERRMLVRLVGVRFSGLIRGNHQIRLFEDSEEQLRLCQAMDHLNSRWGKTLVQRAVAIK
jgi:DNA polymerase IV